MANGNISGSVNIPTKIISYRGEVTNTSTTIVDNEEKTIAVDVNLDNVQEKLVSGTNIKTINSESILGEGNINLDDRYVTLDTKQNFITGQKRFMGNVCFNTDQVNFLATKLTSSYRTSSTTYGFLLPETDNFVENKTLAIDEDVVHKTNDESITGRKVFRDPDNLFLETTVDINYQGIRMDDAHCFAFYNATNISGKDRDDTSFLLYFPYGKSGTIALEDNSSTIYSSSRALDLLNDNDLFINLKVGDIVHSSYDNAIATVTHKNINPGECTLCRVDAHSGKLYEYLYETNDSNVWVCAETIEHTWSKLYKHIVTIIGSNTDREYQGELANFEIITNSPTQINNLLDLKQLIEEGIKAKIDCVVNQSVGYVIQTIYNNVSSKLSITYIAASSQELVEYCSIVQENVDSMTDVVSLY